MTATDAEKLIQLVHFQLAGGRYAVDIMRIKEIINPVSITRVPRAPEFIEGIIELRGSILPVVDLRKRFGLPAPTVSRDCKYIIVAIEGRIVGLIVDRVSDVDKVPAAAVRETPDLALGEHARFFAGVYKRGDDIVMLVDVDQVLSPAEKYELRALEPT